MPVDFTVLSRFLRLRIVFPGLSLGDLIKDLSEFAYADYEVIETVSEHYKTDFEVKVWTSQMKLQLLL